MKTDKDKAIEIGKTSLGKLQIKGRQAVLKLEEDPKYIFHREQSDALDRGKMRNIPFLLEEFGGAINSILY